MSISDLAYLSRRRKQLLMIMADFLVLPFAFYSAVVLRFSTWNPPIGDYWWMLMAVPVLTIPIFIPLGLYRAVIRYADEKMVRTVILGVTLSVLLITFLVVMTEVKGIPRSSFAIFWFLAIAYVAGTRWLAQKLIHGSEMRFVRKQRQNIAIFGAGKAGVQLAMALQSSPEFEVHAFFDDNIELVGRELFGVRVYSSADAERVIRKYQLQALVIAIPSASRTRRQEIIQKYEGLGLSLLTLPGMAELVGGKVRIEDLREVGVEDLLGREPVPPHTDLLSKCIQAKTVLVTGAGGSIGSELCRQILRANPEHLILFESSEFALYKTENELRSVYGQAKITAVLGDVKNRQHLVSVFKNHKIHTVYHAAAYKHVPLVEGNVVAGLENNVLGTMVCAEVAGENSVEHFVLISTDKAVRPTNVMGASKRLAELVLQAFSAEKLFPNTIFSMVRFGNVLGSSGSVVPLFKEQIKKGGPITLTHLEVTRYFMTIPEAAQLVLQAGAMAKGGDVFVLDMGEPVRIYDLASKVISLSGLTLKTADHPHGDIEIKIVGLRPGEKLYEELLIGENVVPTLHPRISRAEEHYLPLKDLKVCLDRLLSNEASLPYDEFKSTLKTVVAEYSPSCD